LERTFHEKSITDQHSAAVTAGINVREQGITVSFHDQACQSSEITAMEGARIIKTVVKGGEGVFYNKLPRGRKRNKGMFERQLSWIKMSWIPTFFGVWLCTCTGGEIGSGRLDNYYKSSGI
jgi:hypothetical protein